MTSARPTRAARALSLLLSAGVLALSPVAPSTARAQDDMPEGDADMPEGDADPARPREKKGDKKSGKKAERKQEPKAEPPPKDAEKEKPAPGKGRRIVGGDDDDILTGDPDAPITSPPSREEPTIPLESIPLEDIEKDPLPEDGDLPPDEQSTGRSSKKVILSTDGSAGDDGRAASSRTETLDLALEEPPAPGEMGDVWLWAGAGTGAAVLLLAGAGVGTFLLLDGASARTGSLVVSPR